MSEAPKRGDEILLRVYRDIWVHGWVDRVDNDMFDAVDDDGGTWGCDVEDEGKNWRRGGEPVDPSDAVVTTWCGALRDDMEATREKTVEAIWPLVRDWALAGAVKLKTERPELAAAMETDFGAAPPLVDPTTTGGDGR